MPHDRAVSAHRLCLSRARGRQTETVPGGLLYSWRWSKIGLFGATIISGRRLMARVAVVTGGTRGIGSAISVALKTAGYKVAANYAGNDAAAAAFTKETGIPAYKFDVSDYGACQDGVKRIASELGPIEILVNNAGITRDAVLHRMTPEQW